MRNIPNMAVTVAFTEEEHSYLMEVAGKKDLSPGNLLRQALRVYQLVDNRVGEGYRMEFRDSEDQPYPTFGKLKREDLDLKNSPSA